MGIVGVVILTALTAAACNPVFGTVSGPVRHATLTSPSGETYAYQGEDGIITATVDPQSTDGNIREVFWNTADPYGADQQTCTTWGTTALSAYFDDPQKRPLQPGLAMRIAPTTDGSGVRAITVTENVWYGAVWIFNVHVWDSTSDQPFTQLAGFDLRDIVGWMYVQSDGTQHSTVKPPPWHVCARTQADQFSFKVWTQDTPEPAWTDPTHVFTVTLPDGWDYPGYSGNYIGHMHAGQWATFSGFTTGPLCAAPDMADTPYCQSQLSTTSTSTSTSSPMTPAVPVTAHAGD